MADFDPILQIVDEEATAKKRQEAVEAAKAKGEDEANVSVEDVKKSEKKTEWDWAVQNSNKPIWTRSPKEVQLIPHHRFLGFFSGSKWESLAWLCETWLCETCNACGTSSRAWLETLHCSSIGRRRPFPVGRTKLWGHETQIAES